MKEGSAALARRDYKAAEADAREVLTKFRTSPRAYDAQFLLAEALAGRQRVPAGRDRLRRHLQPLPQGAPRASNRCSAWRRR